MLPDRANVFLAAYAAGAAASVEVALNESGATAGEHAEWCKLPEFCRRLHSLFVSLESAPPFDPVEPSEAMPPIVSGIAGFIVATDPYGPIYSGWAYEFIGRAFANGMPASVLRPSDVEWHSTLAAWKSIGG
jgi:hypothetical protein